MFILALLGGNCPDDRFPRQARDKQVNQLKSAVDVGLQSPGVDDLNTGWAEIVFITGDQRRAIGESGGSD